MREVKDDSNYYQKEKLPFIRWGRLWVEQTLRGDWKFSLGHIKSKISSRLQSKDVKQVAGHTDLETNPDQRHQLSISDAQMKSKVMR